MRSLVDSRRERKALAMKREEEAKRKKLFRTSALERLPTPVITNIVSFMDLKDLCNSAAPTCRTLNVEAKKFVFGKYKDEYEKICAIHPKYIASYTACVHFSLRRHTVQRAIIYACVAHTGIMDTNYKNMHKRLVDAQEVFQQEQFSDKLNETCGVEMYAEIYTYVHDLAISRWKVIIRHLRESELTSVGRFVGFRVFLRYEREEQDGLNFDAFTEAYNASTDSKRHQGKAKKHWDKLEKNADGRVTLDTFRKWWTQLLCDFHERSESLLIHESIIKYRQIGEQFEINNT